jgi:predicted N-acetyltransferase YhbS
MRPPRGLLQVRAAFVLGELAYYRRFGFRPDLAAGFTSPYAGPAGRTAIKAGTGRRGALRGDA